jgi:glycosyltransferase involved in cell wall biosynthesis
VDTLRIVLAGGLAAFSVVAMLQLLWGYLNLPELTDVPPAQSSPRVSVIAAARDEERHIETAVEALLAQSYPDYELIVIDDRSTDRTADILARLAARHPNLRVVSVSQLPAGWLGKINAMRVGAEHATGELLLFTDADVILRPHALSRAVRLLQAEQADHVTVVPDMISPTWALALVVNYFMMWGFLSLRAWKTRDPRSSAYAGIGAFNLVRADAYRAVGGHSRISLRPDDDLMLGKLLKDAGRRQIVAIGDGEVSVEWYRTLGELARGLRKNSFAGVRYSLLLVIAAVLGNIALAVWPFAAIWLTSGMERSLYAIAAAVQMVGYGGAAWGRHMKPWLAVLYPLSAILFIAIFAAAVFRTLRRGGIEWRGTFYSLDELRANRI